MKDLDRLILTDHITNAGLSRLEGFTKLAYLNLAKSKVTEEKVRKLEKTLPKCKIWYYDRDSAKLK